MVKSLTGKYVACDWCGKEIYKIPSKIRRWNFCNIKHKKLYLQSSKNTSMSKGWKHAQKAKKKISKAGFSRMISEEGRKRLRDFNLGKKLSVETRRKMSLARKGKPRSEETKKKIRESHLKRIWTPEMLEEVRQRRLGKKNSKETRAKIREKLKKVDKSNWGRKKEGRYVTCAGCGKSFYRAKSRIVDHNFHSPECYKKYRATHKTYPWSKKVFKKNSGKNSHAWKGDFAHYDSLHKWVRYYKEKPDKCVDCGITQEDKLIEWSNESGTYKRDLEDYVGRCQSCHRAYDRKLGFPRSKYFDKEGNRIKA